MESIIFLEMLRKLMKIIINKAATMSYYLLITYDNPSPLFKKQVSALLNDQVLADYML